VYLALTCRAAFIRYLGMTARLRSLTMLISGSSRIFPFTIRADVFTRILHYGDLYATLGSFDVQGLP
jgi:hypothetical protein